MTNNEESKQNINAQVFKYERCQICNEEVELEYNELYHHFTVKHRMRTVDYYKKYISGAAKGDQDNTPDNVNKTVDKVEQQKLDWALMAEMDEAASEDAVEENIQEIDRIKEKPMKKFVSPFGAHAERNRALKS